MLPSSHRGHLAFMHSFRSSRAKLFRLAAQHRGGTLEPTLDDLPFLWRVVLRKFRHCPAERGKDRLYLLLQPVQLSRANKHTSAISRIRFAARVPLLLKTIQDSGDCAGCEAGKLCKPAGAHLSMLFKNPEALPIGRTDAKASSDSFMEEDHCVAECAFPQIV